ncbi:4'-phosphopantetheinyl transferase family protein [Planomonospora venezuelensis]|uniref:Holo-[acyl-carrier protein] synthase n=1 Tax=Planomonospora venezuelensis TaxID=1999 RepID=A0A841CU25_PLAVE|nr:4'-phosphopantetheinyl transferase superfamily protein [Planomonospora venezuelensis]MBB5961912.1 holo-[acyl-carrier protein] synthase [Planomonospora venezuelensis]GIM98936.1 hypothetical protein Pve01_05950 [Planomonospora venezuelensis]
MSTPAHAVLPAAPAAGPGDPAVLMGVDIVERDRLARAAARGGEVFTRHITTPAERALGPGVAAFSVKESLIKAVGVRPEGFTWHDFEALADPAPAWAAALLEEAAAELAASTGVLLADGAAYAVRGASARAALTRLGAGTPLGAARWGESQGLFVALAIVYVEEEGVPS